MRLGTRLECVESLLRASGGCHDGAREFAGRRLRLIGRLSRVAKKLTGSWEGFSFHPKKINSGYQWASRKRTRKWTYAKISSLLVQIDPNRPRLTYH
ncbi:hypothetical protein BHM03_00025412 [Ensete ventricosum]|nr:hypothetical protein BHM03_00025412 [Ensete ventricosum]